MVDPNAKITMSFFDLTLDNVRDLIKQAKKDRVKLHSVQAVQFAEKVFSSKEEKAAASVPKRQSEEEKAFVASNIEKEYI
jgi:hypoxanthine phosphoribosyltransferase